jgi:SAM-dependent methyltransferase
MSDLEVANPEVVDQQVLTSSTFWDDYWLNSRLPVEITKSKSTLVSKLSDCILSKMDAFLPKNSHFSVLEVGGAPGQYLANLKRTYDCDVASLDYSLIGCEKTRENFALLGLPVDVYECDLFAPVKDIPRFDVVYSLGLIEHFSDLKNVVRHHAKFVKPGGTLVLGAPSFLGINKWLMQRLSPTLLEWHNLSTMDLSNWRDFERDLGLKPLFEGYIGGFEPRIFGRCEGRNLSTVCLHTFLRVLRIPFSLRPFKWLNSKLFSAYVLGIYRVGETSAKNL